MNLDDYATRILKQIADSNHGLTFEEIKEQTNFARATISGRLGNLQFAGLIIRDPKDERRYKPTPRSSHHLFGASALQFITKKMETDGEIGLAIIEGSKRLELGEAVWNKLDEFKEAAIHKIIENGLVAARVSQTEIDEYRFQLARYLYYMLPTPHDIDRHLGVLTASEKERIEYVSGSITINLSRYLGIDENGKDLHSFTWLPGFMTLDQAEGILSKTGKSDAKIRSKEYKEIRSYLTEKVRRERYEGFVRIVSRKTLILFPLFGFYEYNLTPLSLMKDLGPERGAGWKI